MTKEPVRDVTVLEGTLEIDHLRGVIYFHCADEKVVSEYQTLTPLRIQNLPTPIPHKRQLDITWQRIVNWFGNVKGQYNG